MEITEELFKDLDAFELRLYIYYKLLVKNSGEASIELPIRETSKGSGISINKLYKVRDSLAKKGYLEIKPRVVPSGKVVMK